MLAASALTRRVPPLWVPTARGQVRFRAHPRGPPQTHRGRGQSETDGTPRRPQWSSKQLRGRMSMVFQEPEYQFLASTVAELAIGPRASRHEVRREDGPPRRRTHGGWASPPPFKRQPAALSGGEKRRLSVTFALINAPKLLILDEPSGRIAARGAGPRPPPARRPRGVTLVSITHDPAFVAAMGQRVVDLVKRHEKRTKTRCA